MRDLLILGTEVHAAEMVEIVERVNRVNPTWNLLGLIALKEDQIGRTINGASVLGPPSDIERFSHACCVPENTWPHEQTIPRERLVSLIDPSVFVSRTAQIGVGCVFYPHCYIGLKARIGDRVFCLSNSVINHDDVIEDHVIIASGVTLAGFVTVESDCYLGQGSVCREFLRIGRGSLIGMGSVIIRDVPPNSVMAGNPARKLRERKDGATPSA